MKLAGEYLFEATPQEVWDALFDAEVLAAAMPGCEKLELVDGVFHGDLAVKVGPISGKFTGKVQLADREPPVRYRMIIDGKGPHGFVKANATIELAAEGLATRMRYDADAQVGGKIATVGQRLIETSAKAITKQSLEGLHENIKIRAAHHRALKAEAVVALEPLPPDPEPAAVHVAPAPVPEPDSAPEPRGDVPVTLSAARASASAESKGPVPVPVTVPEPRGDVPVTLSAARPFDSGLVSLGLRSGRTDRASAESKDIAPEYKRADAGKLAAAVTKDVARAVLPWILVVLLSIALVISLVTR